MYISTYILIAVIVCHACADVTDQPTQVQKDALESDNQQIAHYNDSRPDNVAENTPVEAVHLVVSHSTTSNTGSTVGTLPTPVLIAIIAAAHITVFALVIVAARKAKWREAVIGVRDRMTCHRPSGDSDTRRLVIMDDEITE